MASQEVRRALRAKFPVSEVKTRPGAGRMKLQYVAGETVINRLLTATAESDLGYAWQSEVKHVERLEDGQWAAVVHGNLIIDGDSGTGVGGMVNADLDMALKSANTEALKNAAKNGYGVGLELWDKEYLNTLALQRRAATGDEDALKSLVYDLATSKLGRKPKDAAEVAALFGVKAGDLSDPEALLAILKADDAG